MRYHKHLLVLIWKKLKVLLRAILWKTALRPRKQAHCPKDDDRQHQALVGTKGWCWPGAFAAIALRPGTVFRGSLIGSRRVVIDVYHSCFFFFCYGHLCHNFSFLDGHHMAGQCVMLIGGVGKSPSLEVASLLNQFIWSNTEMVCIRYMACMCIYTIPY